MQGDQGCVKYIITAPCHLLPADYNAQHESMHVHIDVHGIL